MAGLYIHIPFCKKKCDYCDFFSVAASPEMMQRVLAVLRQELQRWTGTAVATVYIGGGNPGILPLPDTAALLDAIWRTVAVAPGAEITVELRPEAVTRERLALLKEKRVNRVSLGVQSLLAAERQQLGRAGTAVELTQALELLSGSWENWNADLIYGIPGQTLTSLEESLRQLAAYGPRHLALYNLTVGAGTPLAERVTAGTVLLPAEDEQMAMLDAARGVLAANAYEHYEVSNWAQPGYESRHNMGYWEGDDYIGIGPGAVSCWRNERSRRTGDLEEYIISGGTAVSETETLDAKTRLREKIMLGLRLRRGLAIDELQRDWGWQGLTRQGREIARLRAQDLLRIADNRMWITPAGIRWTDTIIADLLP